MTEVLSDSPIYDQLIVETQAPPVETGLNLALILKIAQDDVARGGADLVAASYFAAHARAKADRESCPPPRGTYWRASPR